MVSKCWGCTTGGGTAALSAGAYNMTSITDGASGALTVTIATDLSSASYSCVATLTGSAAAGRWAMNSSAAVGSVVILACTTVASNADPGVGHNWAIFGDFA